MADESPQPDWKCNFCDRTDGVTNGKCPDCGATQTTPLSTAAQKEAGIIPNEEVNTGTEAPADQQTGA